MYCLFMDVLESQIGETRLWEGLDKNVAVRKRGHTGMHKFREKIAINTVTEPMFSLPQQFRTRL